MDPLVVGFVVGLLAGVVAGTERLRRRRQPHHRRTAARVMAVGRRDDEVGLAHLVADDDDLDLGEEPPAPGPPSWR